MSTSPDVTNTPTDAPAPLKDYLRMWNEHDLDAIRGHLDKCVSDDCLWVDPLHQHVGRDALEANVREFRMTYPTAKLGLASNIDSHNDRHRYEWAITVTSLVEDSSAADSAAEDSDDLLIRGFDVATVDESGMINRVDGFFGLLDRFGPGL